MSLIKKSSSSEIKKNFVKRDDGNGNKVGFFKNIKDKIVLKNQVPVDTTPESGDDLDESEILFYRVYFIKTVDNIVEDVLTENYESGEMVYLALMHNSGGEMKSKRSKSGVAMFEWSNIRKSDKKQVNYTAISYAIKVGDED